MARTLEGLRPAVRQRTLRQAIEEQRRAVPFSEEGAPPTQPRPPFGK